jgi:hypothetical protein
MNAAFQRLTQGDLDPDLTLESPRGGRIRITRSVSGAVRINCDREQTLWEVFELGQTAGFVDGNYRQLFGMRNPFPQSFEIEVNDRDLLYWRPGKRPKIVSVRGVINLLRRRP